MNVQNKNNPPRTGKPESCPSSQPIPSRSLFQAGNELLIEHAGQHYRLRITRQNKLILTK